ncbi:hypothetical protein CYLTODRAFT_420570 [Cylindrobasidium torrendii FP15055 ss-10]|uniref:Uncharacterized protein n=1 Tax=Cylindrobasidium torrendii FP15055 ss-10 TaxID=1314674 RepID=A0A0D7BGE7_9AGAR|nr:hypothetical protein CYLTODRAFT_420570 [Cylindrobasidium torrendii FP15055 ss-10]
MGYQLAKRHCEHFVALLGKICRVCRQDVRHYVMAELNKCECDIRGTVPGCIGDS